MNIEQARQALCDLDKSGDDQLLLPERLRGEIVGAISRTIAEREHLEQAAKAVALNRQQRELLGLLMQACAVGELVFDNELVQSGKIANQPIEVSVRVTSGPESANVYIACGDILRLMHKLANEDR